MAKSFDSATYLRGLGWNGPGSSLNNSASGRSKPVTVAQKKTLSGVGRDRDTSFAWWDAVFTSVATKVGGDKTDQQHRTSTGILSHRPPPPQGNAYEPLTDEQKAARSTGLNLDAMAAVKLEMARRQLYSGFLRGSTLTGSKDDPESPPASSASAGAGVGRENDPSGRKKRKRDEQQERSEEKLAKAERKEVKRKRKEEKEARKAAKRDRKGKGKEVDSALSSSAAESTASSALVSVDVSTTGTPTEGEAEVPPSKEERRAQKKLRKSLAALAAVESASSAASPAPVVASIVATAVSTPVSSASSVGADEAAYLEAKAVARRAEKEERRLAKLAKKALKEKSKTQM
ncbi:uncharacterized protein JCM10292_003485 [Rhodotorula paludigena]|uniref:uncharacterized protein n=1 Tax=Rhodotorula paludigena TaxID=86838 RepID=UPI003170817D